MLPVYFINLDFSIKKNRNSLQKKIHASVDCKQYLCNSLSLLMTVECTGKAYISRSCVFLVHNLFPEIPLNNPQDFFGEKKHQSVHQRFLRTSLVPFQYNKSHCEILLNFQMTKRPSNDIIELLLSH